MGGNAKTTEFLKECMADALIKILKTKPIEKISVPEIVEVASVGRTTFFRNFTTKNDFLHSRNVDICFSFAKYSISCVATNSCNCFN